jgi:hypothetical protein
MWFRRKEAQESTETLATLARRLDDLAAGFKRIEGEWDDAYERIMRGVGRLAARDRRSASTGEQAPSIEGPVNGTAASPSVPAAVLARRSGGHFPGRH